MFDIPGWYLVLWAPLFGALTASFLCVVAERVPKGLSIGGRSRCVCGRQLRVTENLPVVGWLRTRGVAACCGTPIPTFYVGAEVFLAVAWGVSFAFGVTAGVIGAVISSVLVVAVGTRTLGDIQPGDGSDRLGGREAVNQ